MTWNRQNPYDLGKPVIAFVDGVATPSSVMLQNSRLAPDPNNYYTRTYPAGAVISRIGSSYFIHPGANVLTGFATGANTGIIDNPRVFVAGDVLRVPETFHAITFTGSTWTTADIVTITLPGGTLLAIPMGTGSAALATTQIATNVAAGINADPIGSDWLTAIAVGSVVYAYYSRDRTGTLFSVSATSPNNAAFSVVTSPAFTIIGTISAIDYAGGTITLAANAAINVPAGAHVACAVNEVIGIYPQPVDLTNKPAFAVAPVWKANGVYASVLPYIDTYIKNKLREIKFATQF